MDILGEPIVPKNRLNEVEDDENGVRDQRDDVDAVQVVGITQFLLRRIVDESPIGDLVQQIATPCGEAGDCCWVWQFPIIMGVTSVGSKIYIGQQWFRYVDQADKCKDKGDANPEGAGIIDRF